MRIEYEHETEPDDEQLTKDIELAAMLMVLVQSRRVDLLNTALQNLVGRIVFHDIDKFKDIGSYVAFNEQEKEFQLTLYHDHPEPHAPDEMSIWFRHFSIGMCKVHGFHVAELVPPFVIRDIDDDTKVTNARTYHSNPNHPSKLN